jgi:hypothetical protein
MIPRSQLPFERGHVDLLEEAKAECVVYLVERPDDRFSQLLFDEMLA